MKGEKKGKEWEGWREEKERERERERARERERSRTKIYAEVKYKEQILYGLPFKNMSYHIFANNSIFHS